VHTKLCVIFHIASSITDLEGYPLPYYYPDWLSIQPSKKDAGKKSSKTCITVGFACNADGGEKWAIFFIGKSKKPRCFKQKTPQEHRFYYRNNKTSWMTSTFFEE
jgi:hypothetical protein